MTIKECIDIVDNAKPNQYGIKEKVMWLSFVDETIINDVLKTHEGYDGRYDNFEGYTEDKLSVPLIVPSPYDRLYPQYIKMMIDSENGETARYNNSSALYNTYLNEYKKYYNKTHMPINATQKIPSPVSININSHLSDAQIEYIKRQLYYMLSQDVGKVISHDKLYDIAMEYYQNNTEVLKGKDGEKGDKGEDGTKYYGFPEASLEVGSETVITFDFDEDGIDGNTGLSKQDYPGIDEWRTGDMLISANGRVLLIADIIRSGAEVKWLNVRCVSDLKGEKGDKGDIGSAIYAVNMGLPKDCKVGTDYAFELGEFICPEGIKDGDYMIDGDSSCMFLFTDLKGADASLGGNTSRVVCVANLNGKSAEGAMVFKGVVSELPEVANDGDVIRAPYGKVGSFTNCYGFLHIYPDHIEGYDFAEEIMVGMINILDETSESEKPISFNIELSDWGGNVVGSYTIHAISHSYDGDRYYIYGETDAPSVVYIEGGETVTVERENAPYKTVVRFNGEWVEL